jgi:hypothetical protein
VSDPHARAREEAVVLRQKFKRQLQMIALAVSALGFVAIIVALWLNGWTLVTPP